MKRLWLNCKGNDSLIIFFNGWGMDETSVKRLDCGSNDIIMFYDYRNLEIENFDLSAYKNKSLVTWSMGTFVSTLFYKTLEDVQDKIAVNGTLFPIDDKYGIPKKIYDLTSKNFNESSRDKFARRMFNGQNAFDVFNRNAGELKTELMSIGNFKAERYLEFKKAFVSDQDKIIPTDNQLNFWNSKPNVEIKRIRGGHYPFFNFKSWDEIIND